MFSVRFYVNEILLQAIKYLKAWLKGLARKIVYLFYNFTQRKVSLS